LYAIIAARDVCVVFYPSRAARSAAVVSIFPNTMPYFFISDLVII
jgi:hypothetical protein